MNNPYYEDKLKNLNSMLEKVLNENEEIEKQNQDIKENLEKLEKQIIENYDEIIKQVEPLKAK